MALVYEHWRTDTNTVFYVGITDKQENFRPWQMRDRNDRHLKIQSRLQKIGEKVEVKIIFSNLTWEEAQKIEIESISAYRDAGIDLANFTIGGDGARGLIHTQKAKLKMSLNNVWRRKDIKDKHSLAIKMALRNPKTRAAISKNSNSRSPEFREAASKRMRGNKYLLGKKQSVNQKVSAAYCNFIRNVKYWGA